MRIKSLLACAGDPRVPDALDTLSKAFYPSAQVQTAERQTTERNR